MAPVARTSSPGPGCRYLAGHKSKTRSKRFSPTRSSRALIQSSFIKRSFPACFLFSVLSMGRILEDTSIPTPPCPAWPFLRHIARPAAYIQYRALEVQHPLPVKASDPGLTSTRLFDKHGFETAALRPRRPRCLYGVFKRLHRLSK
jgi:hypothetical protein